MAGREVMSEGARGWAPDPAAWSVRRSAARHRQTAGRGAAPRRRRACSWWSVGLSATRPRREDTRPADLRPRWVEGHARDTLIASPGRDVHVDEMQNLIRSYVFLHTYIQF